MLLGRKVVLLLLLFVTFSTCYGLLQEGQLTDGLLVHGDHHPMEHHKHSGFLDQGTKDLERKFSSMQQMTTVFKAARDHAARTTIVHVDNFGAKGNGRDDSQAFRGAWKEACSSRTKTVLLVPAHRVYHLKPTTFSGPCQSDLTMKIEGTIKASLNKSDYERDRRHWLVFENVQNLRMEGKGIINGNGKIWWETSCKINKALPCTDAPTALTFQDCHQLIVADLWFQNAQKMHLTFQRCTNVNAINLVVTAPKNSPNTDGIHVTESRHIIIKNCVIRTGDDCISIVSGSANIRAKDITCGPGHGISIGSLGARNSSAYVSDVYVNRARLSGTTNGLRIKTWQGGSGYAKNIQFKNILMHNVTNPIIIDQYYCDRKESCPKQYSAVQVKNVVYKRIRGTSASDVGTIFNCSKSFPCQGIYLQDITLRRQGEGNVEASCVNVMLANKGKVSPHCS